MNIFVDTIKYKINSLSVKTQDFSKYLNDNGIENADHNENIPKSPVYKRVSNECRDFIKGNAGYFTIFKTFYDGRNKNIYFEFYGLKSYCKCIDILRAKVITLFHQWIDSKDLKTLVSISAIDISFDFNNIHPFDISLERNTTRGKQPDLNKAPKDKSFFDKATYYLYDNEFLEYRIDNNYNKNELENLYNELFACEVEDDYIDYSFMNYNKELSNLQNISKRLHQDKNSLGFVLGEKFYPIAHYKEVSNKILNNIKDKGKLPHEKLFTNNKKTFFNIERFYKEGIYYKEYEHKDKKAGTSKITKSLFVDSNDFSKKRELYHFIRDLKEANIIYPIKPKKGFQVITYDKKNKANTKYNIENQIKSENLSRIEFKINAITNLNEDIEKKINSIDIIINGSKQNIDFQDIKKIIEPYVIK